MMKVGTLLGIGLGASLSFFACGGSDPSNPTDPNNPPLANPNPPPPVEVPPLVDVGVTTLAGYSQSGDADGPRGAAFFDNPVNVLHHNGNVYVADFYNARIAAIDAAGETTTVIRQLGFNRPFGMLALDDETLLIQTDRATNDAKDGALWRFDIGSGGLQLISEHMGRPRHMVKLPDGRIMAVEYEDHFIALLDPSTGTMTPIAGSPGTSGYADGSGAAARFNEPLDAVLFSDTEILVADRHNHSIRKVSVTGEVTTWAGATESGYADGARETARFFEPLSMARADDGTIYVSDGDNYRIRKITPDGTVTTIAGNGLGGYKDDEVPMNAQFKGMEGIDISEDGRFLYIADGARGELEPFNRVRRMTLQ